MSSDMTDKCQIFQHVLRCFVNKKFLPVEKGQKLVVDALYRGKCKQKHRQG